MKPPILLAGALLALSPASLPAAVQAQPPPAPAAKPVEVRLSDSLLTTLKLMESGNPVAVGSFTTRDEPTFMTYVTWSDSAISGGLHTVTWNWYNNNALVSTSTHRNVEFKTCPHLLKTSRSPAIVGTGRIRVDVVVDGRVLASSSFEIRKPPTPVAGPTAPGRAPAPGTAGPS
jgi:hypothetical protein